MAHTLPHPSWPMMEPNIGPVGCPAARRWLSWAAGRRMTVVMLLGGLLVAGALPSGNAHDLQYVAGHGILGLCTSLVDPGKCVGAVMFQGDHFSAPTEFVMIVDEGQTGTGPTLYPGILCQDLDKDGDCGDPGGCSPPPCELPEPFLCNPGGTRISDVSDPDPLPWQPLFHFSAPIWVFPAGPLDALGKGRCGPPFPHLNFDPREAFSPIGRVVHCEGEASLPPPCGVEFGAERWSGGGTPNTLFAGLALSVGISPAPSPLQVPGRSRLAPRGCRVRRSSLHQVSGSGMLIEGGQPAAIFLAVATLLAPSALADEGYNVRQSFRYYDAPVAPLGLLQLSECADEATIPPPPLHHDECLDWGGVAWFAKDLYPSSNPSSDIVFPRDGRTELRLTVTDNLNNPVSGRLCTDVDGPTGQTPLGDQVYEACDTSRGELDHPVCERTGWIQYDLDQAAAIVFFLGAFSWSGDLNELPHDHCFNFLPVGGTIGLVKLEMRKFCDDVDNC